MYPQPRSAGHAIVETLAEHGVERVFAVPGESYLDVLDGLHDSDIKTIVCRHEGGACYMAEAAGKVGSVPGVALVTRGPGAANAMVGIHTAWQDSTPMVLFVGLIPLADRERESFQEFDIHAWFGTTAKRVMVLDQAERASEIVAQAMFAARSGRPGPVVVGLPEDVLRQIGPSENHPMLPVAAGAVGQDDLDYVRRQLLSATRPLVVTGGNDWSQHGCNLLTRWLEERSIPAATDWRSNGVVSSDSPVFIGSLGYGRTDLAARMLDEADLVILIGTVLGDALTDGFTLRQDSNRTTIVVNPDASLRGHTGPLHRHLLVRPDEFAANLPGIDIAAKSLWDDWRSPAREAQENYSGLQPGPGGSGAASMSSVMSRIVAGLRSESIGGGEPERLVLTMGAGNHTAWGTKFVPTMEFGSFLSTRNGSMGYSVPAAIAAGLARPDAQVLTVCGDGEFLMNANELVTAAQYGVAPIVVVMDNGQYGTIRMHQEQLYPGRVSGTQLVNPEFAAYAKAVNGLGLKVTTEDEVNDAVDHALTFVRAAKAPVVIHVVVDPATLLPT